MIFMAGIHGAGKTTIGKKLEEKWNIRCVAASALIEAASDQVMPGNKVINSIEENQEFLLREVSKLRNYGGQFILEGHFCLINGMCEIESISLDVFEKLNPEMIVIISAHPESIARRNKDKGLLLSNVEFVDRFQRAEIGYGEEVGRYLGVPCHIVENDEKNQDALLKEDLWRLSSYR
ncbi:MAG: AAA family ATPase [Lachnospiraceae bacterium]|nr:AAA family ATPase [Lachnospiraceae bacterium]